jgi:hypothetical protein
VQPNFVPFFSASLYDGGCPFCYERALPECSHKEDVPAIKAGGIASQHFYQESWLEQSPEMSAHIIGANREIEGGFYGEVIKDFQQFGHAKLCASQSINIHS